MTRTSEVQSLKQLSVGTNNGKMNSITNGTANGKMNGTTNGKLNGTATNGKVNGNLLNNDSNNNPDELLSASSIARESIAFKNDFVANLVWRNIIIFIFMHAITLVGLFEVVRQRLFLLFAFHFVIGVMSGIGVTGGAHRLWTHKAYKATLPLRIFLAFWFIVAGQNDIYEWCRDHRVHHKFSETDADPHNSNRGFFFAHMGWLCTKKHPEVIRKGKTLDLSDLLEDPVVRFQKKYYPFLFVISAFVIPTLIPYYFFKTSMLFAFGANWVRYCILLHATWLVNSAAHFFGYRPYNDKINPVESPFVIYFTPLGEGFHNYHHTFPYDYKASEYGWSKFNITALFIEIMAYFGQAYDLRTVDQRVVNQYRDNVTERANQKVD